MRHKQLSKVTATRTEELMDLLLLLILALVVLSVAGGAFVSPFVLVLLVVALLLFVGPYRGRGARL
jgi:hypothetical protein